MKITELSTYLVPPRWLFLQVKTDEGISGWGEPVVEGRAATVAAAVDELADYLVGQDQLRIEEHWQVLTKGERLYSRWDLRHVLPAGIAVAQPHPSHADGISESQRIAAMASRTAWPWPRTARSARSPSRPACSSTSPRRTR